MSVIIIKANVEEEEQPQEQQQQQEEHEQGEAQEQGKQEGWVYDQDTEILSLCER